MSEQTNRDAEPEFYVTDDLPLDYEQNVVRGGTQIHDEMSAAKVHRLAAARRNAYRRRSWYGISAALLVVAAIKMAMLVVIHARGGEGMSTRMLAYAFATGVMLLLATRVTQRAMRLTQRLRASDLDEPTAAPDFTPLESGNTDSREWQRANQN